MHFLHINWVQSGNIFNRIVSLLNGASGEAVGEKKENASRATHLNWFCKRWEISVDSSKRTWTKTKIQCKQRVKTVQIYQRQKREKAAVHSRYEAALQAGTQEMAPCWNVKPSSVPQEDRWLAVRISLRPADHHTEHADSLVSPRGLTELGLQSSGRTEWWSGGHREFLCWREDSTYSWINMFL